MKKIKEDFLEGLKEFGEYPTAVINFVLLTFVYFLGAGSSFIISKIVGIKLLDLEFKKKKSYWHSIKVPKTELKSYLRQF